MHCETVMHKQQILLCKLQTDQTANVSTVRFPVKLINWQFLKFWHITQLKIIWTSLPIKAQNNDFGCY